ncbi:MAG: beta-carotene 15,15'-dioxygenase, Brp/Blh family [Actinobacteria bacterium]|nr:beta-carotene 15,15'-dioxygenase, Brp/Blh family [Actinomycetota bacterium]MSV71624.1 beta-carotene 15,15'-dioxygenase, Brp/Blh family [Actinomycetota bacterium]MSW14088.1 beta-carotene 15,15'-dioxygenase, Brp/Blh family [Actinomycetota bacterium]MSX47195.1 beta-carotene 15,15'-dioxygenase, Brp/Blh family [Actinomycetota bacterium]MSX91603.1 beta-carotene 15,15'-dioxygenase, Brp/Blh family [Actinomycetota bacterium]
MGEFVPDLELELLLKVRKFSRFAIGFAIVLSFIFAQLIESSDITWQVVVALIALAVGIPHGALDHLVTMPRTSSAKMALFILGYVAVAIAAVVALLTWNVIGFIGVVVMSAVHFGIGDAAFISEIDRRSVDRKYFQKYLYAAAAGTLPVVIPLVSEKSNSALEKVNPQLLDWHQGLNNDLMLWTMVLTAIVLLRLVQKRRDGEAIDLVLLYLLAATAPPLVAFAVYFGCWHAMRHTARLTLTLPSSQAAFAEGNLKRAFIKAVLPGTPALIGTFVVATAIVIFRGGSLGDQFLWVTLVVVWALTVPHMAVTARLDRKALS